LKIPKKVSQVTQNALAGHICPPALHHSVKLNVKSSACLSLQLAIARKYVHCHHASLFKVLCASG